QFGLWTRYDFVAIASALALGAEHVGERVGFDAQTVKPYTVFDLSWQTRWRDWKFQANVKNLFDRRYAVSGCDRRSGHFPGEPRRVYVQATWAFGAPCDDREPAKASPRRRPAQGRRPAHLVQPA